jgi:type II secretory pathway pseudopilin PulG
MLYFIVERDEYMKAYNIRISKINTLSQRDAYMKNKISLKSNDKSLKGFTLSPIEPCVKARGAGFTLVEITIAVGIILLLSVLSIHGILRARMTANEAAAVRNLRTLYTAFISYRVVNPGYPKTLNRLVSEVPPYIDSALVQGQRQGYRFALTDVDYNTFRLVAIPLQSGLTGNRIFIVDQGGEIYENVPKVGLMPLGSMDQRSSSRVQQGGL